MNERVLSLISRGIDSSVSACIAAERFEVIPLHFCLYPLSSYKSSINAFKVLRKFNSVNKCEKVIIFLWEESELEAKGIVNGRVPRPEPLSNTPKHTCIINRN
ncbi:hypothetical protein C9439_03435 [archaeon SCG-AAA382B04]|nr:hypothetical protein C9439_03435 [archaeon SCG-AAA382B04]